MSNIQFTSVNRVLGKFHRDLKGTNINESDAIEWVGEALDFMRMPLTQEQHVAFIEVSNHEANLPKGFQSVLQIARSNKWSVDNPVNCSSVIDDVEDDENPIPVPIDCNGLPITDYDVAYYRPFFDLRYLYDFWRSSDTYKKDFTPVRLADNSFFNSLVCKENDYNKIYQSCEDEYTIVGGEEKKLRFSFETGYIALAYWKTMLDEQGYPLVPDQISAITAITYYIKWKIAEWYSWNGREGMSTEADKAEAKWGKYIKQANNWSKMPKGVDDHQDLLDQSNYLIPRRKRYYGFFGKLAEPEQRDFKHPNRYR